MSDKPFDERVAAIGGDPTCLHCRLVVVINEHLQSLPELPGSAEIIKRLAEVLADHVLAVDGTDRFAAILIAADTFNRRIGLVATAPAEPEAVVVEPGRLH